MTVGARIQSRLTALGMKRIDLARRVGLTPGTINGLVRGRNRSSAHLHRIADALHTTSAYLEGEIDDPSKGASPPPPKPVRQYLELPVALPAEAVLTRTFKVVLAQSRESNESDRARSLAKCLPGLLRVGPDTLWSATFVEGSGDDHNDRMEPDDR